jgi:hypothetical protein
LALRHGTASRQMSDRFRESCASSVSRAVPSSSARPRATAARSASCAPEASLVWTHHFATSASPIERQRRPRSESGPGALSTQKAASCSSRFDRVVACHGNSLRDAKRARHDLRYRAVIDPHAVSSVSMEPRPLQLLQRPASQRWVSSKRSEAPEGLERWAHPIAFVKTSDNVLTPYRRRISESRDN